MPLDELWASRYTLREAMLPCFVAPELAHRILLVGKTINFIRLGCGDAEWSLASPGKPAARTASPLAYGDEEAMHALVDFSAARAHAHVLRLVVGEAALPQHLFNLKQYLLLGRGDFVQHLMEHLNPQLAKPADQL